MGSKTAHPLKLLDLNTWRMHHGVFQWKQTYAWAGWHPRLTLHRDSWWRFGNSSFLACLNMRMTTPTWLSTWYLLGILIGRLWHARRTWMSRRGVLVRRLFAVSPMMSMCLSSVGPISRPLSVPPHKKIDNTLYNLHDFRIKICGQRRYVSVMIIIKNGQ